MVGERQVSVMGASVTQMRPVESLLFFQQTEIENLTFMRDGKALMFKYNYVQHTHSGTQSRLSYHTGCELGGKLSIEWCYRGCFYRRHVHGYVLRVAQRYSVSHDQRFG